MSLMEIEWKGPYTRPEVQNFYGKTDYGIYQLYGTHNILGTDALLYIGRALQQTFSTRLLQRDWLDWEFPEYKFYLVD